MVRHGKSQWNDLGLWTGWLDIDLHSEGELDARKMAEHLCNFTEQEVCSLEIGLGEVHIYEFDSEGNVINQEIRGENPNKGKI